MQAQKHGQHVIILFIFRCQDGTEMKNILAFDVGNIAKKIPLLKKTSNFFKTTVYLIFWIKVIPFPLSLVAESPYTRNRRSKHPMLFATLCPLLILTTTPLFGNSSV